jgi:20S proteasome subunit beta 7
MAFQYQQNQMPITHTQQPIVTGTSVLGIKYKGGVLMCADTCGSYGSMARFTKLQRIHQFGDHTVIGFGGDMSDMQYLQEQLTQLV